MKAVLSILMVLFLGSQVFGALILTPDVDTVEGDVIDITVVSMANITSWEFAIEVEGGVFDWIPPVCLQMVGIPCGPIYTDTRIDVAGGDFFVKEWPVTLLDNVSVVRTSSEAVVTLRSNVSWDAGTVFDVLVITPEPGSLILLGLGGLMLRRRGRGC